ncbi:MAG: cell division protein FtsA [Chloroflexi bacterium]|jgi:cell division protein FtsA|nr:cell division protein FtsA [Chloroflexota bacterium]MBT3669664.1 cell division protein FtsA [Chloroflexota bacterium]MBT4533394.1 cell division protein FtsA [Chloroflexota bacterium]MBT4684197.1 cell division protein FtsA [Chloroflexota bacterium]MBT4754217.1 cell division protein FtsA [Chloroflexota bacterium]
MSETIVVGIDIGTTKVCTLVARMESKGQMRILGVGIEPAQGIRKGTVVDLAAAGKAIALSIDKAERSSGLEITSALVSLAGSHVSSINSRGVASVSRQVVDENDINRAMDAARAVAIPHNREVIHVIQRGFTLDGQDGIRVPNGMHGYRMEVEAHIITAAASTVDNIRQVVGSSGVDAHQFVLNPLASAEVVLTDTEREMGVVVCDIGGGTSDMALFIEGDVWHTMVLAVGGNHITSDIAHGLRLPFSKAEEIKINHGHALTSEIGADETFPVKAFGEEQPVNISRRELTHIIEARVEEIFSLMMQEIKRSGYDGLLPAGLVLTGGTSQLPGIRKLASEVMGLPVRLARPENLIGMVDKLHSPAYSTSIGLVHWALLMNEIDPFAISELGASQNSVKNWDWFRDVLKRFLP